MALSVVQANPTSTVKVTTNPYQTPVMPRGPAIQTSPSFVGPTFNLQGSAPALQGGSSYQLQPAAPASVLQPAAPAPYLQPAATASQIQPAATANYIQPAASASMIQPSVGGSPKLPSPTSSASPSGQTFGFMDGSTYNSNGVQVAPPTPNINTGGGFSFMDNSGFTGNGQYAPPTPSYTPPTPSYNPPPQYQDYSQSVPQVPQIDTSKLDSLEKQLETYTQLSPEEIAAQAALNQQNEAYLQGSENTRNKVIPMEFITGQLESLDRANSLKQIPLQQQLALAQAKRQTALDASKYALSYEQDKAKLAQDQAYKMAELSKPITVAPGGSLVNPQTGQSLYQNPALGNYQANPLTGQLFDTRTGQSQGGGFTSNSGSISIPGNTLAAQNNNPGNLRFAGQAGATQGAGGFAKFSSPEAGFQALVNQIQLDASRGATLSSFINKYAPPSENNTSQYIQQAMQALGVSANTPLSQININSLSSFMAKKESGTTVGQSNLGTDVIGQLAQQVKQNPNLLQTLPDAQQKAVIARLAQNGQNIPQAQTTEAKNKQQSIGVLQNTVNSLEQLGNQIGWKGVGGAFQGSISQFLAKNFGTGSQQEQMLRSYIGQVQGTIAKERGGTSFTPNEQALLETYTPTINDSPLVIQSKLAVLKDFINNTVSSYGGQGGQTSNNDPLNLGI